jgi:hypothetical protein
MAHTMQTSNLLACPMETSRLAHVADLEAERRGLGRTEFLQCVARSIEESYRLRGRIVNVALDDVPGANALRGVELRAGAEWVPLRRVHAPPAWLLEQAIERLIGERKSAHGWRLERARAIHAHESHVDIELAGEFDATLRGAGAVLPRAHAAPRDAGWEVGGPPRLVAVRPVDRSATAGSARWVASRTEPALMQLVVRHYFGVEVRAASFNGSAMLIVPTAGDAYAQLVGKEGAHADRLRDVLGMDRVFVAREPQSDEPFARLTCAVARVTGLKRREYTVRMPRERGVLPALIAERAAMPRLVGRGGQNLYFIRRLSGVAFRHLERGASRGAG